MFLFCSLFELAGYIEFDKNSDNFSQMKKFSLNNEGLGNFSFNNLAVALLW